MEILGFIAFIFWIVFFIWFGITLNAIKENTRRTAEEAQQQSALLRVLVNKESVPCARCGAPVLRSAKFCNGCGQTVG